jgi:hypothetical protein
MREVAMMVEELVG